MLPAPYGGTRAFARLQGAGDVHAVEPVPESVKVSRAGGQVGGRGAGDCVGEPQQRLGLGVECIAQLGIGAALASHPFDPLGLPLVEKVASALEDDVAD